jgi:hypothetical protein
MTTEASSDSGVPTLEAVGALAGVSRATVSRVINGSSTVKSRSSGMCPTAQPAASCAGAPR